MKLNDKEMIMADAKLKEIADILLIHNDSESFILSLMGGKIGHALFFYYYYKYSRQEIYLEKCINIITEAINVIPNIKNMNGTFSFAGGLAGFGWLLDNFNRNGEIDFEDNDFFSELSAILFKEMKSLLDKNNFDFFYGAIGICWYFIKTNHKNIHEEKIRYFLKCMQNKAIYVDDTCYWEYNKVEDEKLKEINLGLAHGIPSLIVILSEICKINNLKDESLKILKPSISLLINLKQDISSYHSFYPYMYDLVDQKIVNVNKKSRLAWCYGDLSVSWALLKGGIACNDAKIINYAKEIILYCTTRRHLKEEWVFNAIVCHGSAGNALLFKKFSNNIQNDEIEDAVKFWIATTFSNDFTNEKYLFRDNPSNKSQKNHSLLEGIAGIGLVILSFISKNNLTWDECLLLS